MTSGDGSTFGDLLRHYRFVAGLTHEALAERATLSARAISDLERGVTRAPRRATLALLAQALELTPGERRRLETAARRRLAPDEQPGAADNLPPQLTSFIGRQRELQTLGALLRRGDTRLVTLTGAGGTGKTRLALRVAEDVRHDYPDGISFVPLAPVTDADGVIQAVAQALDISEVSGPGLEAAVVGSLQHRQLLLLLDNFEHLLSAAPLLARLLGSCPGLTVLVTSRAALRLSGEQEFPVSPLPVPDLRRLPSVEALSDYAAITLFVERAARVRPEFRLTADNGIDIAAICVRLDGLPLALELAAARTKLLPPRALLARLEGPRGSPLRVLTGGARDLPSRQQTLRATIAWSYDLLTQDEQRLFRRLAIFVGGCDLDAVEAICIRPPSDRDGCRNLPALGIDAIEGVASLVDKSLLHQDDGPAGESRFGMLETIREFASEELDATDEAAAIRSRHARYFLDVVETSGAALLGAARQPERLAIERDNIRMALRWLVESG